MSSTDQTQKSRTTAFGTPDSPTVPIRSTPKLDLSPTKITGGALAAMTAAALGAQLSVVGTVIGAAVASVIAAVASALYTTSLEHTGSRVRRVWQRGDAPVVIAPASREPVDAEPEIAVPEPAVPDPADPPARRRLSWSSVLVGALVAFGLAAVALTGIELITGQALSGGDGTTVSQVSGADERPAAPADSPSPTPERKASAEPTSSPSAEAVPTEAPTPATTTSVPATEPTVAPSSPAPTETQTEPSSTPSPAESETVSRGP